MLNQGELFYGQVPVGQSLEDSPTVSEGRWCLSPRSLVPFVQIQLGSTGFRSITWGEAIEIPKGQFGRVVNASNHPGDIVLIGIGDTTQPPARPASITVPATVRVTGTNPNQTFIVSPVDARLSRRIYLCSAPIFNAGAYTVSVATQSVQRRSNLNPLGASAQAGVVIGQYTVGALVTTGMLPVGIGIGGDVTLIWDTMDLRPMANLDRSWIQMTQAAATVAGLSVTSDLFYVVEY